MTEGAHAPQPCGQLRIAVEDLRQFRRAMHVPQAMRDGEVGDAGGAAHEELAAVGQVRFQPAEVGVQADGGIGRCLPHHVRREGRAIGGEGFQHFGRRIGEDRGDAGRLHGVRNDRPEEDGVGPLREHLRGAGDLLRIQRRLGVALIDQARHQRGVAIDVGADLQERRLAVAAGQRDHVGLGHDHRHGDRAPCEALVAEDQPYLLRERRGRVVMKNQLLGHAFSHSISRCGMLSSRYSSPTG